LDYRYPPEVFHAPAEPPLRDLDVLYVVGGLYGNEAALHRVLELFERERGEKALVFNGDFHWFDADPAAFARVQRSVLAHTAMRGNVETELAREPADDVSSAGCGCAYPAWVGDDVVERSNRILGRLAAALDASQRSELARLPMWLRAEVAGVRLGLVHGDATSLAGWGFDQEHLRDTGHREVVAGWIERAGVDAFCCSHTCLPVFQQLRLRNRRAWVLNNGAAGMPNFRGDGAGLLTRLGREPLGAARSRCGAIVEGAGGARVHAEGVAIETDGAAWRATFLAQWPAGSDAHASYFDRIEAGPQYAPAEVVRCIEQGAGGATGAARP
jgi:hypothetical protein